MNEAYENILIYNISYKPCSGPKPLRIRFQKIDGYVGVLDVEIKHLVLLDYGLFDKICDRIKYLVSQKSGITPAGMRSPGDVPGRPPKIPNSGTSRGLSGDQQKN